jgi:VanZ family protein
MLRPLIHWIAPAASDETIALVHAGIRKLAHLTEYAVLGALVVRALEGPWSRPQIVLRALAICAAYAALDELHQRFVPSRTGAVLDVAIDLAGAAFGMVLRGARARDGKRRPSLSA